MKSTVLLTLVLCSLVLSAQVADTSYTDCDGNTESIYGILGQGKPLIVESKGLDCSICMSQAPGLKTFSETHPQIRLWAAMNNKYTNVQPTCPGIAQWKTDYAWNNIFMFLDLNDKWVGAGFPYYSVISPVDSEIVYQGFQFSEASAVALTLAPTGITEKAKENLSAYYDAASRTVRLKHPGSSGNTFFLLYSSAGQKIFETQIQQDSDAMVSITLTEKLSQGIYLAVLRSENKIYSGKLLVN